MRAEPPMSPNFFTSGEFGACPPHLPIDSRQNGTSGGMRSRERGQMCRPHRPSASALVRKERREVFPEIVHCNPERRARGRLTEDGQLGPAAEHSTL